MKVLVRRAYLAIAILLASFPFAARGASDATRVACVGDSITYGSRIPDRAHDSYPAQLAKMLGPTWDVRNFGRSGATLLHAGDKPYVKQSQYTDALAFVPQIVVICLGTNDSKAFNWEHKQDFIPDYDSLIDAFRKASPDARIYICFPVPVIKPGNYKIDEQTMVEDIDPAIQKIAADKHAQIIDLHAALDGNPQLFPDRVHPNAAGAELMAETVMHAIAPGVATQPSTTP